MAAPANDRQRLPGTQYSVIGGISYNSSVHQDEIDPLESVRLQFRFLNSLLSRLRPDDEQLLRESFSKQILRKDGLVHYLRSLEPPLDRITCSVGNAPDDSRWHCYCGLNYKATNDLRNHLRNRHGYSSEEVKNVFESREMLYHHFGPFPLRKRSGSVSSSRSGLEVIRKHPPTRRLSSNAQLDLESTARLTSPNPFANIQDDLQSRMIMRHGTEDHHWTPVSPNGYESFAPSNNQNMPGLEGMHNHVDPDAYSTSEAYSKLHDITNKQVSQTNPAYATHMPELGEYPPNAAGFFDYDLYYSQEPSQEISNPVLYKMPDPPSSDGPPANHSKIGKNC